ncbi:hypothetical protein IFM89_019786 [Coptis chinensis]|uniref:Uncharacterized protein n=1 Tax=Coptis chinensis TaxID=261450 RepID=A0A835H4D6_9MAGN|nr:hypothetical protein IFM89_019786 [Coptis chinensis]
MGNMKSQLLFCWDQSHCSTTRFYTIENNAKLLMYNDKDDPNLPLEKRECNESNSLLVDHSPYKWLNPVHTAIFPTSYDFRNKNDNSLGHGEENEKLKKELKKKVNTLEQDLLLCKEENEKFKEELREKVNTLEQELLLCKEENGKLKEKLKKKVNTLEQELLLCKEENEKFKEELKKKDQQERDKEEVQPQTNKAVHHHVPNKDVEMVFNEDA